MRWIGAWPVLVCTTLMGCLISTSGFSGGRGATTDAGLEAVAPVIEASTPDASPVVDGGAEAGADADAGDASTSFCTTLVPKPAFCEDFDVSPDLASGWQHTIRGANGGTQALDGTTFTSGGHSLATTLPAGAASYSVSTTIAAAVQDTLDKTSQHVTLDFDLRFEAGDSEGFAQVATLLFGDSYQVHFMVSAGALMLQEDIVVVGSSTFPQEQISSVLTPNTWTHVRMDVQFGSTNTITITLDTQPPFVHPISAGASNGNVGVEVGAVYFVNRTVAATALHQDNVVVRME